MKHTAIESPVINSRFEELRHHFRFIDLISQKLSKQQIQFETESMEAHIEGNKFIDKVWLRIKPWNDNCHFGVRRTIELFPI